MSNVSVHKARAHSRIGPSATHRWIACPGSVLRSKDMPNRSTFFALEGSAAHELCEYVLVTGEEPSRYRGGIINLKSGVIAKKDGNNPQPDDHDIWRIDQEMVEAVELYRDHILGIMEEGDELLVELKLSLEHVHPDMFGSSDAIIYRPRTRHMFVIDFKYGSGLAVEVDDNSQLLAYAIGAAKLYEGKVDSLTLIIIQPRAFHTKGPIRQQEYDVIDLLIFEEFLRQAALKTDDPNAEVEVGHHCRFCLVAHCCDDLRAHVLRIVMARFKQKPTESALPRPEDMTPDQLGRVVRECQIIEAWVRRVLEYAHAEAMEGRVPTGCKVVEKRAYRKWKDKDAVETALDLYDVPEDEYMTEPEEPTLRTPAQLEKVLGKKLFNEITKGLVTKSSPGVVLAPIEDHREAVNLDKGSAFGAADDDNY